MHSEVSFKAKFEANTFCSHSHDLWGGLQITDPTPSHSQVRLLGFQEGPAAGRRPGTDRHSLCHSYTKGTCQAACVWLAGVLVGCINQNLKWVCKTWIVFTELRPHSTALEWSGTQALSQTLSPIISIGSHYCSCGWMGLNPCSQVPTSAGKPETRTVIAADYWLHVHISLAI